VRAVLLAGWAVLQSAVAWLVGLPLDLLGLLVVPFAILFGHNQVDITGTRIIYSAPKWLWLWGNQQDGYDPRDEDIPYQYAEWRREFGIKKYPRLRQFILRYLWAAWRNKTSNVRFLGLVVPKKPIKKIVGKNYVITTSGWLTHWLWTRKKSWTAFGARLDKGWTKYGTNFAMRLRGTG
jgi:hypothetical protein